MNQDGSFEILAIDNSGNVACKDLSGKMVSVKSVVGQVCCLISNLDSVFNYRVWYILVCLMLNSINK